MPHKPELAPGVMTLFLWCRLNHRNYQTTFDHVKKGQYVPVHVFRQGWNWYADTTKPPPPDTRPLMTFRHWARKNGMDAKRALERWREGRIEGIECKEIKGVLYVMKITGEAVDHRHHAIPTTAMSSRGMATEKFMRDVLPEPAKPRFYDHFFWCRSCRIYTLKYVPHGYSIAGTTVTCKGCGETIRVRPCPPDDGYDQNSHEIH